VSYWLPTPSSPEDKATVAFHIEVPAAYKVRVPGTLEKIDTLAYGNVIWHYTLDRPVAVYTVPLGWGVTRQSERREESEKSNGKQ
jgi:hypothetical protein